MNRYLPVIGLEIHCQLKTKTKIFSSDPYEFGKAANTQVGPVTLALPGVLPVLNQNVLELAIVAGLALNCKIAEITKFDRKHYFYPDLPKGYQISQFDMPYATNGNVEYYQKDSPKPDSVRIHRIHMEEDAGKLLHSSHARLNVSYVDLNRAGVPLIEIVTEPDIRSSQEAYWFLATLGNILRYTGITDGNMEEGSLRCDANVSVRKNEDDPFGTRVEIKNLNSFKAVRASIDYEIERQSALIDSGGRVIQSTVLWDADQKITKLMRTKEDAEDYRYFPEPDLPAYSIKQSLVDHLKITMPELPDAKKRRYISEYHLPKYDADVLTGDKEIADYFEQCLEISNDPKKTSNWVKDEVLGIVNKNNITLQEFKCNPLRLGSLINLINQGKLTGKMAKKVFEHIYEEDLDPDQIINKYDYKPVDIDALPEIIENIMDSNKDIVEKILNGNSKVKGFLVGQVMKKTNGQANPEDVNRIIDEMLLSFKNG